MKLNIIKVMSFAAAALCVSGSMAYASSSDSGYDKESMNNRTPGWSSYDKGLSEYSMNYYKNTFSSTQPQEEDDSDSSEDATTYSFDQVGPTSDNSIASTWSVSGTSDFWAKTSDGKWMLLLNGMPSTGWQYLNGSWYYMDADGIMQTGWVNTNGNWYYLYEDGTMAYSTWIDGYYLNSSGAMSW